jgi:Holliday junction resolvase RusA-like endonuclease
MIIRLPVPPSVNGLYRNAIRRGGKVARGRYKTRAYKAWLDEADKWMLRDNPLRHALPTGRLSLSIILPLSIRGDVSNYIKAAEDYLVSREITADDRHNWRVSCEKGDVDCCVISIESLDTSSTDAKTL